MISQLRALSLAAVLVPCVVPCLAYAPPAFAQDDPQVTAEARKRFQEGVKLFDEKKYELARASFLQAYALKKHPDVLLNLAQAELLSGKALDAVNHFKDFLRDPATKDHPKRGAAERGLAEGRQQIGRIQVAVDVGGAEILLDGHKVGESPLADILDVAPGPHVIEAKKGDKAQSTGVLAAKGKITTASLSLEGGAAIVPPPAKDTPKDPPKEADPAKKDPPKATEPAKKGDADDGKATFSTSDGKREPFMTWAKRSPVAWAGAGLFGIGLVGGIAYSLGARADQDSANKASDQIKSAVGEDAAKLSGTPRGVTELCKGPEAYTSGTGRADQYVKACRNYNDALDARDSKKTMTTVSFVGMGIGAGVLVGGYFLTAKKVDAEARTAPRFVAGPVFSPGYAGLSAGGRF